MKIQKKGKKGKRKLKKKKNAMRVPKDSGRC